MNGTSFSAPIIAGLLLAAPQELEIDGYVNNDPDGNPDPILTYNIPLTVSVIGPTLLGNGEMGTWQATVDKGGDGSYSYQWYYTDHYTVPITWVADGTDSEYYSHAFQYPESELPKNAGVKVVINDGDEQSSDAIIVTVQAPDCPPYKICL